jgi:HAE1 family hydrophobic/amphiphilic exporter-1/multidrug efflux pump
MLGFSINTLTVFGLVLAIGLVVDDAIVVVEAVEHHIEEGMAPREATEQAMEEVGGALIAIALVLTSVFVPVAFMSGIVGQLYRQFAITLAVSILLSALVALTLSPALCAMLLRPKKTSRRNPVVWAIKKFNSFFDRVTNAYVHGTGRFVRAWPVAVVSLLVVMLLIYVLMQALPTGFVPNEDQGYYMAALTLPEGASLERTDNVVRQAEAHLAKLPGLNVVTAVGGYNMLTGAMQSNAATLFIQLKHWDERLPLGLPVEVILERTAGELSQIAEAVVIPFMPPSIPGLGVSGGFQLEIEDRGGQTVAELVRGTEVRSGSLPAAGTHPCLQHLSDERTADKGGYRPR